MFDFKIAETEGCYLVQGYDSSGSGIGSSIVFYSDDIIDKYSPEQFDTSDEAIEAARGEYRDKFITAFSKVPLDEIDNLCDRIVLLISLDIIKLYEQDED